MQISLNPLKILVKSNYLSFNMTDHPFTAAYLMSVQASPNSALLFTVYTEHGAIFSGLPLEALLLFIPEIADINEYTNEQLQPYSCLEGVAPVISYELLKDASALVVVAGETVNATYLFTIPYCGRGLAEDPEQTKTHNIMALYNGQLAALPNNHCLFQDNWFVGVPKTWPPYSRREIRYKPGT